MPGGPARRSPGLGPISAELARELAGQAGTFTQVVVGTDGQVQSLGDPVRADRLPDLPVPTQTPHGEDVGPVGPVEAGAVADDGFLTRAVIAMRRPPAPRPLGSSRYRPGVRLTRFLRARDRTCVFPGCRRPAAWTDLDHRDPWPRGSTSVENLQCVCRHHHRAKHAVFTTQLADDGATLWTTRGGQVFRREPHRHRRTQAERRPQGD